MSNTSTLNDKVDSANVAAGMVDYKTAVHRVFLTRTERPLTMADIRSYAVDGTGKGHGWSYYKIGAYVLGQIKAALNALIRDGVVRRDQDLRRIRTAKRGGMGSCQRTATYVLNR